jgi:hypothetical protein
MAMNTGLLFGEVMCASGAVEGAMVDIVWLTGDSKSKINIQVSEDNSTGSTHVLTDSSGKYVLPFVWDGTQIAKAVTGMMKLKCFAFGNNDTERKVRPAHLCMNLKALISAGYPTFDNPTQDALDAAKDFILAFRQIKAFPPHHKAFLSTEIWGILARANFFVLPPKK